MAKYHVWVAAVCLLICMFHSSEVSTQQARYNVDELLSRYSTDGSSLTKDQLLNMLTEAFSNYVQDPNLSLTNELFTYADNNQDDVLDKAELEKVLDFVTRDRD